MKNNILFNFLLNFLDLGTYLVISLLGLVIPVVILFNFAVVVLLEKPIVCLLNLICGFILTVILLLQNTIGFFPLVLLIVYVGAVSILFLFVIMLLSLSKKTSLLPNTTNMYIICGFFIFLPKGLFLVLNQINSLLINGIQIPSLYTDYYNLQTSQLKLLAKNLYETNSLCIVLITFVLLATLISAVLLSRETVRLTMNGCGAGIVIKISPDEPTRVQLFKATHNFFISTWSLSQWVWTLLSMIVLYFLLFHLYNRLALKLSKSWGWKPYLFNNKIVASIILIDLVINFIIGIIFMLPAFNEHWFAKFLIKCPIAISPFILVAEILLLIAYLTYNWYYNVETDMQKRKQKH